MATQNMIDRAYNTTPIATTIASWDASKNLSANNNINAFTTTVTAAGTTTLTVASTGTQFFTGVTTQTVVLPVTSTLQQGQQYYIVNLSSDVVTVQSSGANTIIAMAANTVARMTCILTSGTSAASWFAEYDQSQLTLPVAIVNGGTGVTSVTTTPTATAWAGWDANKNFSADSFLAGYTTTATAAGTTTLTVDSTEQQFFTGSTTQTVVLPVTSTLALGQKFRIVNNSTGVVTVQSSGANTIQAMAANTVLIVTCILTSGTTAASWSAQYDQPLIPLSPMAFNGRLTLTSGVAVTTSDVTAATTVYFTPYMGNQLSIYNGTNWTTITFTETSIAVPSTTNTVYDLFAQNNAGTLALVAVAWTNDTTRATTLSLQNGVYCETGVLTNLYLGSFRTTAVSGQTEDSSAKRWVWNYNNRVLRPLKPATETTDSWTYSTASFRQSNANAANQLDLVVGVAEDSIRAQTFVQVTSSTATARNASNGIGLNSTTVNSANLMSEQTCSTGNSVQVEATFDGFPVAGRNFLAWLEIGAGTDTQTWFGDGGVPTYRQMGISGLFRG